MFVHIMEYYSAMRKGYPAVFNNMDGPSGHCAKWGKSEKDKYNITNMQN